MRPLDKVIDATLKLIPQDLPGRTELQSTLEQIKTEYLAAPSDSHGSFWFQFASHVAKLLGDPDVKWKEEVAELLQGKKDYSEVLGG